MPRKRVINATLVDSVAQNLFLALPVFRKRLLHLDVLQRDFDIPLSHVQVLSMLCDNGSLTVSEISRRLGIAKPNITPLIDRLIDRSYVKRERDEEDRRMVNIALLPTGLAQLTAIRARMVELVGDWASGLTNAQLRTLDASLRNITQIMGSAFDAAPR